MGSTATKVLRCLTDEQKYQNSYFYKQQTTTYSYQLSDQCLRHIKSLSMASYASIKKIHRYLHPALKFIISSLHNQQYAEVVLHYQEDLLQSSAYVAKMYMNFLQKVVPTNITYFHFMRENQLYSHYIAILYILHCGHLHESLIQKTHVYGRLSDEELKKMLKSFSHWLYDMVKYYCSAIYIKSYTMPHLIKTIYTFIVGILQVKRIDFLTDFSQVQKQQIYEHLLYVSTYFLCKVNRENDYSMVQVVCGCLVRLCEYMQIYSYEKEVYTPSYWYVEEVGYISEPSLQKICIAVMTDVLNVEKKKNCKKQKNIKMKKDKNKNKNKNKYSEFSNEEDLEMEEQRSEVEILILTNLRKDEDLNEISYIYLLHAMGKMIGVSKKCKKLFHLRNFIENVYRKVNKDDLARPFILSMISELSYRIQKVDWYYENNRSDFIRNSKKISYEVVKESCEFVLNNLFQKNIQYYERQINLKQSELWAQILKYHQIR